MNEATITRATDAISSVGGTEYLRFLLTGGATEPGVYDERLGPGDGPPLHKHP